MVKKSDSFAGPVVSILLPSRPQIDTLLAIFLLKKFGEDLLPGISGARVGFFNPQLPVPDGSVLIDCGSGIFDHHGSVPPVTASTLVARALGIEGRQSIKKILDLAHRDDVLGKGIISTDGLDRAFGLPGLLAATARSYPNDPNRVIEMFLPVVAAHYAEEEKRTELLPREFDRLSKEGDVEIFSLQVGGRTLKAVSLTFDDASMAGYLRSNAGGRFDVVALWRTTGHLAVTTKSEPGRPRIDLSPLAVAIRRAEAMISGTQIPEDTDLSIPGKLPQLPNWHYDTATNSILNGGAHYQGTESTKIPKAKFRKLAELAFRDSK